MMQIEIAPRVTADLDVRFGKPVVRDTRVDIETVIRHLATGMTISDVAREYGLDRADVVAALNYAAGLVGLKATRVRRKLRQQQIEH